MSTLSRITFGTIDSISETIFFGLGVNRSFVPLESSKSKPRFVFFGIVFSNNCSYQLKRVNVSFKESIGFQTLSWTNTQQSNYLFFQ